MKSIKNKILPALGAVVLPAFAVAILSFLSLGQSPETTQTGGRIIKWKMLSGKDNEFFFAIPETSVVHFDKDISLDKNHYSRVDSLKTMVCRINDTVLQISLYEGASKEIEKRLIEHVKKVGSGVQDLVEDKPAIQANIPFEHRASENNGFAINDFIFIFKNHVEKSQIYRFKERVYLLKSVARHQNDQIAKDFFESVKLVNGDTVVSPNLNNKSELIVSAKMVLPKEVKERSLPALTNATPIEPGDADQMPVLAYIPRPSQPSSDTRFDRGFYLLKLKVLLQADGKVGDVETITKVSKEIEKESIAAAKEIVFLPARKDGKEVSTYLTIRYSLAFVY